MSRKVEEGADVGCLNCSALTGFISGHPATVGVCLGLMSLQTLSVFGSFLVRQNLDSHVFFSVFGYSPLQLPMCLALMALGCPGLVFAV